MQKLKWLPYGAGILVQVASCTSLRADNSDTDVDIREILCQTQSTPEALLMENVRQFVELIQERNGIKIDELRVFNAKSYVNSLNFEDSARKAQLLNLVCETSFTEVCKNCIVDFFDNPDFVRFRDETFKKRLKAYILKEAVNNKVFRDTILCMIARSESMPSDKDLRHPYIPKYIEIDEEEESGCIGKNLIEVCLKEKDGYYHTLDKYGKVIHLPFHKVADMFMFAHELGHSIDDHSNSTFPPQITTVPKLAPAFIKPVTLNEKALDASLPDILKLFGLDASKANILREAIKSACQKPQDFATLLFENVTPFMVKFGLESCEELSPEVGNCDSETWQILGVRLITLDDGRNLLVLNELCDALKMLVSDPDSGIRIDHCGKILTVPVDLPELMESSPYNPTVYAALRNMWLEIGCARGLIKAEALPTAWSVVGLAIAAQATAAVAVGE